MIKKYTLECRLDKHNNLELIQYFDSFIGYYNKVTRVVWHIMQSKTYKENFRKKSHFVTYICKKYNLLKRVVNSIVNDVEGNIKKLRELKKYEIKQLKLKIKALIKYRKEQSTKLETLKKRVVNNDLRVLEQYRNLKIKVYYLSQKINKKNLQVSNLERVINNNEKIRLCYGSKIEFKKQYYLQLNKLKSHQSWKNNFLKNRDKVIHYVGSGDESYGNQLFNLIPDGLGYKIRVRKHIPNIEYKYINGYCHLKNYITNTNIIGEMQNFNRPLTYRIIRRKNKWYLQVVVEVEVNIVTRNNEGVIGLDYNEGFIELSETDKAGNLINNKRIIIKDNVKEKLSGILKHALNVGKDIAIEDLNFNGTKGKMIKAKSKRGKIYNRMLSRLGYGMYKEGLINSGARNGIGILLINPINSSKNGAILYNEKKKLTTHQSASYVIARRGMGLKD